LGSVSSLVSEKKIFEILVNQSILLALAAISGHRLTMNPMGKCSNAFFSETTNMIKAKLYMNGHWTVFYNLKVFCSDMKFKMAATAGLSLTLDPMGKMFQWRPSWISDRHKKQKLGKEHSNDHSFTVWVQSVH
jgi:hypothetical protein